MDEMEEVRELLDRLDRRAPELRRQAAEVMRAWAGPQLSAEPLPAGAGAGRYGMVGEAPAMLAVYAVLDRIVRSEAPILILGESGTGKELVARALHEHGPRRKKPWVAVNCAAIPGTLLESELFGHVKGAFTGAVRERKGYAEAADGGSLFLDEIGEMPPELQAKLLRFLQEGEVRPVGGNLARHVDVRVIAATNRDLLQGARERLFREDLYYRLAVITIRMPPLRERLDDLEPLARFILARHQEQGLPTGRIEPEAMSALAAYHWPGNIRELQNELTRAAAFSADGIIRRSDLSPQILAAKGA